MLKCKICFLFDCGSKCKCICHNLATPDKIRHDLLPNDSSQLQKITESDIELVAEQTDTSKETAKKALMICKGDLASAILYLTSKL